MTRKRTALVILHLLKLSFAPFYWTAVFALWVHDSIEAWKWPDHVVAAAERVRKWGAA